MKQAKINGRVTVFIFIAPIIIGYILLYILIVKSNFYEMRGDILADKKFMIYDDSSKINGILYYIFYPMIKIHSSISGFYYLKSSDFESM